jgi:hypothetical protein
MDRLQFWSSIGASLLWVSYFGGLPTSIAWLAAAVTVVAYVTLGVALMLHAKEA